MRITVEIDIGRPYDDDLVYETPDDLARDIEESITEKLAEEYGSDVTRVHAFIPRGVADEH